MLCSCTQAKARHSVNGNIKALKKRNGQLAIGKYTVPKQTKENNAAPPNKGNYFIIFYISKRCIVFFVT